MSKTKKPKLVILLDGLNDSRLAVYEKEINSGLASLKSIRPAVSNTTVIYNGVPHTLISPAAFVAQIHSATFYDVITSILKEFRHKIKKSKTQIHIIHNSEDQLDYGSKTALSSFLESPEAKFVELNFYTTLSSNYGKALDFGVIPDVYSTTSAGAQLMVSAIVKKTAAFLKGN